MRVTQMLDAYLNVWLTGAGGWSVGDLWSAMDWLSHADIILLALMLVNTLGIVCDRLYHYSMGSRQSRAFVREATALGGGNFDDAMAIVARNRRSHVATVVAAGLLAFASAPQQFTKTEAIDAAVRAFQRRQKMLSAHLKLGIGALATIASSAPLIGLLGAMFGIMHAFRGVSMARASWMAMVASSMAEAMVTTAAGLLVGIPAGWCRNYLCGRIEQFESEMSNAALEAVTYLHTRGKWRERPPHSEAGETDLFMAPTHNPAAPPWEVPYDRQRLLLFSMCSGVLYFALILASGIYGHWSYLRQGQYEKNPSKWEQIGGQEAVSPDGRYRAVVPMFYREKAHSSDKNGYSWSCASSPEVALRILPNDRPRIWVPYPCGTETKYALEPDQALLTWNCSIPVVTWRTNDELLIQCNGCSSDNTQLARPSYFPDKITILDAGGKPIRPQVIHPQLQCFD